jgi:hypothetical protein
VLPLVVAGLLLIVVNGLALRAQRRYTHSIVWRGTIGRLFALRPGMFLASQRYRRAARVLNVLGLFAGVVLVIAGIAG